MTDSKKPGVTFWATVVGVVVVLYVASFGPATWLSERVETADPLLWTFYRPISWICDYGPRPIRDALESYVGLCSDVSR